VLCLGVIYLYTCVYIYKNIWHPPYELKGDTMFDTTIQDQLRKMIFIAAMIELAARDDEEEMMNCDWF